MTVEYGPRRALIVAGVMAATLMQTLDSTITNVALPTIQGNIGASVAEATWVVTSYTIAAIIVIPLTPWLQMRFGRRNYYVASIVGFTLASVMCGDSGSLGSLAFWRVVQGLFGGGLLATGQVILRDTFPPEGLSLSQGIFTLGAIMGPALGPPLGGILVDNWSWNWCFDINVVPGTFAAIVLFTMLRDPAKPQKLPVDIPGVILLALMLGSMQYVLTEGEQHYWLADPTNLLMTIVFAGSAIGFVGYELFGTERPIVDLRVLKNRSVWSGTVMSFAQGAMSLGATYVIPQFVQGSLGFTPTLSGMLFVLRALPVAIAMPFIVKAIGKVDPRFFIAGGFLVNAFAMFNIGYITGPDATFWSFAFPLFLSGVSSAALFIPVTVAVLGASSAQDAPKAGAFLNLALQLGGSVAVAMLDVLIDRRDAFHSSVLASRVDLHAPQIMQFLQAHTLAQLNELVQGQSAVLSYADSSYVIAALSLLCVPLILLMHKAGHVSTAEIEIGG